MTDSRYPIRYSDEKDCRTDGDDEAERVQFEYVARSDSVGYEASSDRPCQSEEDRRSERQVLASRLDETRQQPDDHTRDDEPDHT